MKTIIALSIALTLLVSNSFSQLKGSGKTLTKTFDFRNFDTLNFIDLDGKIDVEVGKPFIITATIDDNLSDLLSITENQKNHSITVSLKGNENNCKYIEDTNIKITIHMPSVLFISHFGNSHLTVKNILGTTFEFENGQNAISQLNGKIDELKIRNSGNGNTYAEHLLAKKATIKSLGNGNVCVDVSDYIHARASGNSTIKNKGKASFDSNSSKSGNARLIYP